MTVFVDMYGCTEQPLPENEMTAGAKELFELFDGGSFAELVERCTSLERAERQATTESVVCVMVVPVALLVLDENQSGALVERTCAGLPTPGPRSDARQGYLGLVFAALDHHAASPESRLSDAQLKAAKVQFANACGVAPEGVPRVDLAEFLE